jgi:glycosyltransferase involved in cell wall biosynthesis
LLALQLDQGGSERQLAETALSLDRTRFSPHAGVLRPGGLRAAELSAAGIPVVHFPVHSYKSPAALTGAWKLSRYIRRHGIRLVHSFDAPLNIWAVPAARLLSGAAVVSSQRAHRQLTPGFRTTLLRLSDRFADGIVVNCLHLRHHLMQDEGVPDDRIHLCYNGIDVDYFRRLPARPEALPEDALVIGVVCALRPEKDLATLIEAFARIRKLGGDLRLAIVGSGPELPLLQQRAADLSVAGDCLWQPATRDVPHWLSCIDIFVLPSLTEGLSNSLMEAMSCGCCVVASRVGGNPELVEDGVRGLLVEPRDVDGLAHAMQLLIERPGLRHQYAAAGSKFIRDHFSRQTATRRMAEIYDSILSRR